jgi:5-methylphenazine-1-carboxylate 1-monooxygenase
VVFGHRVSGYEAGEDGPVTVIMETAGGGRTSATAEVVIGCDGIHSAVRRQLYPGEGPPRYSGVNMWRGVSLWPRFLTGASMVRIGWFDTAKVVIYPVRPDAGGPGTDLVNWVVEREAPAAPQREWNRSGRLQDFIGSIARWRFGWLDVPGMVRASAAVLEYPMVDQDPLPRWSFGRVTLLGDAAHPMLPRGSNGAGQAILDARALAGLLAGSPGDPVAALRRYDDLRRPFTAEVVRANRVHPPDAILREVHQRTGDRPFARVEDVISEAELREMSERYKRVAGFPSAGQAGRGPREQEMETA